MDTIPNLGFGTYKLSPQDAYNLVLKALQLGYRHIDTAHIYKNEEAVGQAIRDSGVPREEIWVTTKVWNKFIDKDQISKAVDMSLEKLNIGYLDMVLIHGPRRGKAVRSYQLLEEYQETNPGRVRFIGVSNYKVEHLEELEKVWKVVPKCNQIEISPFFKRDELVSWCSSREICVVAHSSLTRGQKFDHDVVVQISKESEIHPSQVLLGWARAKGLVLIPGASCVEHMQENWDYRGYVMGSDGVAALDGVSDEFALFPWFG